MNDVLTFYNRIKIQMPYIKDAYIRGRRRKTSQVSNLYHYQIDLFYVIQELNNHFNKVNTKLLLCIACLNPRDSFSAFDKEQLLNMATFYPYEFSNVELLALKNPLQNYIVDVQGDEKFANLSGMGELSKKMVETKKHNIYPLVYLLLKLALILPVTTVTVE